ncbi:MAG: hypothetical protein ACYDCG_04495 [Candidatus Acidiferrales bacterium]
MQTAKSFRMSAFAIGEWLLVLPATVLLAAAALRLLQPRQYEPARTSWIIFEWATTHISRLGAALLFIGMPAVLVLAGAATLLRVWREDQALRQDAALGLTIFRRHIAVGLFTAATLLAAVILTFALAHLVTD